MGSARAICEAVRTGELQPTLDFEAGARDEKSLPPAAEDPDAKEFWDRFHAQERDGR